MELVRVPYPEHVPNAKASFLVPLDLSRVPWTEPFFQKKLGIFLKCMSQSEASGGWSPLFSDTGLRETARNTRWLLSFSMPMDQMAKYNFRDQLLNISRGMNQYGDGVRAVIMVGTQALTRGCSNPINSVNLAEDFDSHTTRYLSAYEDDLEKRPGVSSAAVVGGRPPKLRSEMGGLGSDLDEAWHGIGVGL